MLLKKGNVFPDTVITGTVGGEALVLASGGFDEAFC
jgi:hypothetical protein